MRGRERNGRTQKPHAGNPASYLGILKNRILSGQRILVVEDEPILALDIEAALLDAGAEVIGPAITLMVAQKLARQNGLSAAALDVRLGEENVYTVAYLLQTKEIPFVFHTAHASSDLHDRWPGAPLVNKPSNPTVIVRALAGLLGVGTKIAN